VRLSESLYMLMTAIFIKPTEHDWMVTNSILGTFVEASGLLTNLTKIEFYPIKCEQTSLKFLSNNPHNHTISSFPCNYLGFPLHFKKLSRSLLQLVIQKIANRLLGWKRNFSHI
jgi:hypothetical protein